MESARVALFNWRCQTPSPVEVFTRHYVACCSCWHSFMYTCLLFHFSIYRRSWHLHSCIVPAKQPAI